MNGKPNGYTNLLSPALLPAPSSCPHLYKLLVLTFRSVPRCFTKGEQLRYQSGRGHGTEENMSVRRVRRRNAMPCDAMLCHADDETRRSQARLISQGLHAASFACRLPPTAWHPPTAATTVTVHAHGIRPDTTGRDVTGATVCPPRRRGQLSEVPANPLSSAILVGSVRTQ